MKKKFKRKKRRELERSPGGVSFRERNSSKEEEHTEGNSEKKHKQYRGSLFGKYTREGEISSFEEKNTEVAERI